MAKTVEFEGTVLKITDAAVLFDIEEEQIWFPKAHITVEEQSDYNFEDGEEIIFEVPEWMAKDRGLI